MRSTRTLKVPLATALAACLPFSAPPAHSGTVCTEPANRFRAGVFADVTETPDLDFGSNKNPLFNNRAENFKIDLYRPAGDACAKRPAIVFIHGGWFQGGGRKDDAELCRRFAKLGFVASSIDYRLAPAGVFTPANFGMPAYMSAQDARAAVRFLRKNAATYGIDTALIYVGGCSAGGYATLATAYLDKPDEIPSFVDTAAIGGGIEGLSGNPGYSSAFAGAINISGGIFDTADIVKGDKPVVSVQCQGDPIVSPGRDSLRNPSTGKGFLVTFGSTTVHARAGHVGIPNKLYTFPGSCHCPENNGGAFMDTTVNFIGRSVYGFMEQPTTAARRLVAAGSRREFARLAAAYSLFTPAGRRLRPGESPARYPALFLAPRR